MISRSRVTNAVVEQNPTRQSDDSIDVSESPSVVSRSLLIHIHRRETRSIRLRKFCALQTANKYPEMNTLHIVASEGRYLAELSLALILLGLLGTPSCLDIVAYPVEWCTDHARDEVVGVHVERWGCWILLIERLVELLIA
jgi:hypothetical protein